jgi:F-type H+-transporting ATPase subunit delta
MTANFLGVLAQNRRLASSPASSDSSTCWPPPIAARPRPRSSPPARSTTTRSRPARSNLKSRLGRDVSVDLNVDPAILGGLVVKIGSQMIDGSIRTKLNNLASAMKG